MMYFSKDPCSPSAKVDEVWHFHMSHDTLSYFKDCKEIFGNYLHHNPTEGGKKEIEKFKDLY